MEPRNVILRCGIAAQVLYDGGDDYPRPLIGVYAGGIPISWTKEGYHLAPDQESNLDIVHYESPKKKRKTRVQKQLGETSSGSISSE